MAYTTGDTVVHPRHGIATVEGTITRVVGKRHLRYLDLAFASPPLRILVPVDSVADVGLRELSTKQQAAAILAVLAQPSDVPETWRERSAATASRIRSTDLAQASMVVRDLTRHEQRSDKPLSRAESTDLRTCLATVSSELSLALGVSEEEARDLILRSALAEEPDHRVS